MSATGDRTVRIRKRCGDLLHRIAVRLESAVHRDLCSRALNARDPDAARSSTKLHLGCGAHILPGWLNADLLTTGSAPPGTWNRVEDIFIMDAAESFPFDDGRMRFVFCEDFIEHFSQLDGLGIIAECHRILAPGGVFRISTPGFDAILRRMQPRSRAGIEPGHWAWGHKLLYTEEYLSFVLGECGFGKIVRCRFGQSGHRELQRIDAREEQQDLNIIVEATK